MPILRYTSAARVVDLADGKIPNTESGRRIAKQLYRPTAVGM